MIERRMVTLSAFTLTKPWMSSPSMTVPSTVMVRLPSWRLSFVPAGTPVLSGPGRAPADAVVGAVFAGSVARGLGRVLVDAAAVALR
jgi:hypothetical protein